MIAETGLACLWLAASLAFLQLLAAGMSLAGKGTYLAATVRPVAILQGMLVAIAFALLVALFLQTDLSVKLVAINSHSAKPWLYKFAGTWGNHEGSMLLWVTIMGLSGACIAAIERRLRADTMLATLAAQAFVSLGFYAFLLFSSNPFERLPQPVAEGQGLNPLLQDPGLAFHPPTLYIGYVGLSVAFSFAVGALVTRNVSAVFARAMRPWVLGAWIFLTIGITAGSYWAYYELGWGGWWFWDPVENASLMPWLAATALLHSVSVLAARGALRTWTVMLAVVAFSMSMVGTFLVRSGILTSVHAFAVDPERGTFILVLLAIYIGGALALFGIRANTISEGARFHFFSREGALVINNVLLTCTLGIVLIGTLYPLLTEAFGTRVSVGPPYFDPVAALFVLPMLIVMGVGPLLRWRSDSFARLGSRAWARMLVLPVLAAAVALAVTLSLGGGIGLLPLLGLTLSAWLALASLLPLWGRNLLRTPLNIWGMVIAHMGIAVALFGMASESAYTTEVLVASEIRETHQVGPYAVTLDAIEPVAGDNWTALQADMSARLPGSTAEPLTPQSRTFVSPPAQTSEAALLTRWNGQLYVVLGDRNADGRWQLRLWWKPFVPFIWYGGLLIALGGLLALIGRTARDLRHRQSQPLAASHEAGRFAV